MKQDNELPLGWKWVKLENICEINPKRKPITRKDDELTSFVPMAAINEHLGAITKIEEKPFIKIKKGYTYFEENDVLFAKITPCMENGKQAIAKKLINGFGFGTTEFHVIRVSEKTIPEWIYLFVRQRFFLEEAAKNFTGSVGQQRVPKSFLETAEIPLPPLNEQHRIITEIEKQFSRLDESVSALKRIKANLKRYKASVLKSAVEGKLTAAWREQHPALESTEQLLERILKERRAHWEAAELAKMQANGKPPKDDKWKLKYKEPVKPDITLLPELPAGWVWATLIMACEAVVDCHNKTAPYEASGIPLIRTSSIRDMKLNFDSSIRYVSKETYKFWSKRCPPQSGDILFTREAPMGEAAIIPEGKLVCMGQRIMLFRADKNFLSEKYLLYAVQNLFFKKIIDIVAVGTGVKHLRVGDVEKLPIPLPPLAEQAQIVAEVEKRLSVAEEVEQQINRNLKRAEHLRQATLKRAFSGKLVPQNPADEPASVLLEKLNQTSTKKP